MGNENKLLINGDKTSYGSLNRNKNMNRDEDWETISLNSSNSSDSSISSGLSEDNNGAFNGQCLPDYLVSCACSVFCGYLCGVGCLK